jgi:hypothetical protein
MSPSMDVRERRAFAVELKFLVSPARAAQIRGWARAHLMADPHATDDTGDAYQVTSLYFDTEAFDVFHRHGSFGRSKYRIRRYGRSEVAFLERKLKTRGLLAKRRSVVPLEDLPRLADADPSRGWAGYWFHRRLRARGLRPVCQIAYLRTARVARTPQGPIRLTLDENLRAQPASGLWFHDRAGALLSSDRVILELKFRGRAPVLFKYLVEEFALNPQPVSKYRLAVLALGLWPAAAGFAPESQSHPYARLPESAVG